VIRERTIAWCDPRLTADASRGMAGLDLMCGLRDGTIPVEGTAPRHRVPDLGR